LCKQVLNLAKCDYGDIPSFLVYLWELLRHNYRDGDRVLEAGMGVDTCAETLFETEKQRVGNKEAKLE